MKNRSFTIIIHKEEDTYIAECPEVGTVDRGETIEKAISLREAFYDRRIKTSNKAIFRRISVNRKFP